MTDKSSRDIILECARAEFAEHGYGGARVDRIAARSGLNKQLIYYYFRSKAGLHAATIDAAPGPPPSSVTGATSAMEGLRGAIARLLEALAGHPEIVSTVVDRAAGPTARSASGAWMDRAGAELATLVSSGQGLGYFRDDVDPGAIASQALVLCVGYFAMAPHLRAAPEEWASIVADTLIRATAW